MKKIDKRYLDETECIDYNNPIILGKVREQIEERLCIVVKETQEISSRQKEIE